MASFWTQFKSFVNNYKYVLLLLLFLLLCFISIRSYLKGKSDVNAIQNIIKAQSDSIKYFKDETGKLHAQVISQQASSGIINAYYKPLIDSLANQLKIKDKQISAFISVKDSTSGSFVSFLDTIVQHDTLVITKLDTSYRVNYADYWLKFSGYFKPNSNLFHGSYTIIDSLSFITYNKPSGFLGLGPKKLYLDVSSSNPNTIVKNIRDFSIVNEPLKPFAFGPAIIVTYTNGHISVVPGIGVSYSLWRF